MNALSLILDLEQQGFREQPYVITEYEGPVIMGGMANGTAAGNPVVMIAIEDPETEGYVVIQTSLALFLSAGDAFKAKYGDPRLSGM